MAKGYLEDEELVKVLEYAKTREAADCTANAILMRVDIHRFFDQYQWSIYKESFSAVYLV